jgi:hypothetical protein
MSVIPALRRLRQKNREFEASLHYVERPRGKKKEGRKKRREGGT